MEKVYYENAFPLRTLPIRRVEIASSSRAFEVPYQNISYTYTTTQSNKVSSPSSSILRTGFTTLSPSLPLSLSRQSSMASISPRYNNTEPSKPSSLLPSPRSLSSNCSTTTSGSSNNGVHPPKSITRSEPGSPYPTTFVQADTSSFKQVVQMLTGSSKPAASNSSDPSPAKTHAIPPIKSTPKKQQSSSGFKLYERRNSLSKNLKISPLIPSFSPNNSGFSPRKPEILSPSILDFPSLVLSPVTPLIPDPFDRTSPSLDKEAEEKAIKEKGFFLHPSPASTPRDAEPRLLPLFPTTSPRVSGSSSSASSS
ncbi:VQ motif-containing protein 4-like [Prosopis cineraria]|uniref:VQ motif-containing protein 4-like n=1 Tax=Prosopis cineraria TaxID=364024 RepID=UPI0024102619|nr:VQ motif-containing protein 4-like [Prosopis cineraria]